MKKFILALLICAGAVHAQSLIVISGSKTVAAPGTVATPTFSPVAGTYSSTQTVTISTTTPLAVLCYTTDGSTPTEVSHLCSGGTTSTYSTPLTVSTTQTVKAIGTLATYTDSTVASATYTISAATPAYLQSITGSNCGGTGNCTGNAFPNALTAGSAVIGVTTDHIGAPTAMTVSCGSQSGSVIVNTAGTIPMSAWLVNNTSSSTGCTVKLFASQNYGSVDGIEISNLAHGVDGTPSQNSGSGTAATSGSISVTAGDAEVVLLQGTGGDSSNTCVGLTWKAGLGVNANDYSVLVGVAASTGTWTPTCTMSYSTAWNATAFALKP